jgi:hypothetical protein
MSFKQFFLFAFVMLKKASRGLTAQAAAPPLMIPTKVRLYQTRKCTC